MKLLLTSDGWSTDAIKQTFLSLLVKPPQECSIFLIVCVQSPEEQRWIDMDREELQSMGIEKISVYNLLEEKIPPQISADVLSVCVEEIRFSIWIDCKRRGWIRSSNKRSWQIDPYMSASVREVLLPDRISKLPVGEVRGI